jgi:hypothetical protein
MRATSPATPALAKTLARQYPTEHDASLICGVLRRVDALGPFFDGRRTGGAGNGSRNGED